ncbi:hypothetical protein FBU30_003311 [Linnemannia zychae]|nr:hypothetical protein FBU30_003311 [Linnemannia zychae]
MVPQRKSVINNELLKELNKVLTISKRPLEGNSKSLIYIIEQTPVELPPATYMVHEGLKAPQPPQCKTPFVQGYSTFGDE